MLPVSCLSSQTNRDNLGCGHWERVTKNVIPRFHYRYLMNFLLDATLGMLVIWVAVKLVSKLVEYKQWTLLVFGEYGEWAACVGGGSSN